MSDLDSALTASYLLDRGQSGILEPLMNPVKSALDLFFSRSFGEYGGFNLKGWLIKWLLLEYYRFLWGLKPFLSRPVLSLFLILPLD